LASTTSRSTISVHSTISRRSITPGTSCSCSSSCRRRPKSGRRSDSAETFVALLQPTFESDFDQGVDLAVALDRVVEEHDAGFDRTQRHGDCPERQVAIICGGRWLQLDHGTAEQRPETGPIAADPIGQVAGQLGDLRLRAQFGQGQIAHQDRQRGIAELVDLQLPRRQRGQQPMHLFGTVALPQAVVLQRAIAQAQIAQVAHLGHDQAGLADAVVVAPVVLQALAERTHVGQATDRIDAQPGVFALTLCIDLRIVVDQCKHCAQHQQ